MAHTENMNMIGWDVDVAQSEKGAAFFKNTIIRTLIGMNILLICAGLGILGYFIRPTDGLIIFHYNVYFGVDLQGSWWQAFLFPVAGGFFLSGHLLLARHFYGRSERIAAYLMIFGSCLVSIGALIASIGIAFINY